MAVRTGMIHQHVSNQSGISLVEVLISAMIAAGISLTVAQISVNLQKGIKGAERSGDWVDLKGSIQRGLASPSDCSRMLSLPTGMSSQNISAQIPAAGSSRPLNIGTQGSPQIIQAGSVFGSGLRIVRTELRNPVQETGGSGFRWTADLFVEASTQRNAANSQAETYGAQTRSQTFKVTFLVQDTVPPSATAATPFNSCVGSDSDMGELADEVLARVPKDTWVIGQTQPYDCYASNGTELQACINLPGSAGGPDGSFSKMLIKAGLYRYVYNLRLRPNFIYEGVPGRTIFDATGVTGGGTEAAIFVMPTRAGNIQLKYFNTAYMPRALSRVVFLPQGANDITIEGNKFQVSSNQTGVYFSTGSSAISQINIINNTFERNGGPSESISADSSGTRTVINDLTIDGNQLVGGGNLGEDARGIRLNSDVTRLRIRSNRIDMINGTGIEVRGRQENVYISDNEIHSGDGIFLRGVGTPATSFFAEGIYITDNRIRAGVGVGGVGTGIDLQSMPESTSSYSISRNSVYVNSPPTSGAISSSFAPQNGSYGIRVSPAVQVSVSENSVTGFERGIGFVFSHSATNSAFSPRPSIHANIIRLAVIGIFLEVEASVSHNRIQAHLVGIGASTAGSVRPTLVGNDILMETVTGVSINQYNCAGGYYRNVAICLNQNYEPTGVFGNRVTNSVAGTSSKDFVSTLLPGMFTPARLLEQNRFRSNSVVPSVN